MSDGRLNKWWSQATVVGKTVLFFRAPGFRLSPRCKVASRNLKMVPSDFQKRVQASKQASKHLACLLACLLSGSNSCSVGAGRGEGRAHVMRKKGRTTAQVFKKHDFKDSSILAEDAGPQRGPATARTCTSAQRVAMSPSKLPEHPLDMRDSARQGHQGHTYVLKGKGLEYCRL